MDWLSQNWVWVLFFVAFMAMHMFGHAGHAGHGGHRANDDGGPGPKPASEGGQRTAAQGPTQGHHH